MYRQEAREEYAQALKAGQREYKALTGEGKNPYPAVLEQLPGYQGNEATRQLGTIEIPIERIVGIKTAGRTAAFSAGFMPLLSEESEFAAKWISLCAAHLSSGIRDPIVCFEYLGNFYVQEGNKRVSVLKHFGAARVPAVVTRIIPKRTDDPHIQAYYEFMEFFKHTGLYQIQFRHPGEYAELLAHLGKEPEEDWTEMEQRTFSAYFQYFKDSFDSLNVSFGDLLPEEALLLWLRVYSYQDLCQMTATELKKTVSSLWEDLLAIAREQPVEVQTEPVEIVNKTGILGRFIALHPDHVHVAFVHPMSMQTSEWVLGHEQGRKHLEDVMGEKVTVSSYFHADTQEQAEALLEQAVEEGADVVFTTTPQLSRPTLKMAVKYPKVRFLNCSVDTPYSSIRTYYGRIYEAKFITGAIAGAMANDDRIGYIGSNPIFGVPASINAFALGAQMTNPRAKICLRWSCMAGAPQEEFLQAGIRVFSNRDVPTQDKKYLNFCSYGTYQLNENDQLEPLASPCWVWGAFYEKVIRSILAGTWEKDKTAPRALNYWWGMDSGMIDVNFADHLPEGVETLARLLREALCSGELDPFRRRIIAQDGTVKNDGSRSFTAEELLHMDWLCENVEGSIPEFEEIEPFAQPIVRALGIHRDRIPVEKEETK